MIFLLLTLLYLIILLKINLLILLKEPSREKALLTLHVMTEMHLLLQKNLKYIMHGRVINVCDALTFLLDNIFIRFGTKLYRQVVGTDFYGDLVYKLKKIVGSINLSAQFIKIISDYKKIGYNINVLQQTACLVVNPITVGNFTFLFNNTPVGRTSDSMMVPT